MVLRLDGVGPKYAQITRALAAAIQNGTIAPGSRVPPTRVLAADLACSRNLILLAYEQLSIEGYLVSRRGGGTYVSSDLPPATPDPTPTPPDRPATTALSARGRRIAETAAASLRGYRRTLGLEIDFMYGLFEPDTRLVDAVRTGFSGALRTASFGYPRAGGDDELRRQLALRLRTGRGITRSHDRLVITGGTQQALSVCARLLLDPGDGVVVEDPTYEGANSVFTAAGAEIVRVPVDEHGLVVSALPEDGPPVRLVYITPSHQFPTGAVMSAARRYALLAWARRRGALIFEDDYDSELRYTGRPIEALAALDTQDCVIYCGTLAKSLFPSLRIGYLSLPEALVAPAAGCRWLEDRGSPLLLQRTVARLMSSGEYDRHLRRTLRRFRSRRDVMVAALEAAFGSDVEVLGADAGAHVVIWFRDLGHSRLPGIVAACEARGVGVYPVAGGPAVHAARPLMAGLLLGYGIVDERGIERGIRILAEECRACPRPDPTTVSRSSPTHPST